MPSVSGKTFYCGIFFLSFKKKIFLAPQSKFHLPSLYWGGSILKKAISKRSIWWIHFQISIFQINAKWHKWCPLHLVTTPVTTPISSVANPPTCGLKDFYFALIQWKIVCNKDNSDLTKIIFKSWGCNNAIYYISFQRSVGFKSLYEQFRKPVIIPS